ncbi:MAG: hypothetical protein ACRYGG_12245 [Janthinobacterium lividum]
MINKILTAVVLSSSAAFAQHPACLTSNPPTCIPVTESNGTVDYPAAVFSNSHPSYSVFTKPNQFEVGLTSTYRDPDYGGGSDVTVGAFAAYDVTRAHVGLEVSANQTPVAPYGIRESEYLGGVRVFQSFGRFKLVGKGLIGETHFNGEPRSHKNRGDYFSYGAGGGFEYSVSRHFVAGLDADYLILPSFANHSLTPFGAGGRIAYRF